MNRKATGIPNTVLSRDFIELIECLVSREVDFVLVGSYALGIRQVVRATGDIDFLYRRTKANVARLCAALADFGAPTEALDEATLMTPDVVAHFGTEPQRVDFMNSMDGVSVEEVWAGATMEPVGGHRIRVIGEAELLKNKRAANRPKDVGDVRALLRKRKR